MEPLVVPPMHRRAGAAAIALVLGRDHDPALRPLFAVRFLTSLGFAGFWTYLGIWAHQRLGASEAAVGTLFLLNAIVWTACSWLRRPPPPPLGPQTGVRRR